MELPIHTLNNLFSQLGLPSADTDIDDFVRQHSHLDDSISLADATCWTKAQADFLRQAIELDADWSSAVDQLNTLLRFE